jgi:hypothetical protein
MTSQDNKFSRVADTSISGTALLSVLSGADVAALNYQAAVNNYVLSLPTNTASVVNVGPWLQQAAISQCGVLVAAHSGSSASIYLADQSVSAAQTFANLLNLQSSSDVRILNFTAADGGGALNLAAASTGGFVIVAADISSTSGSGSLPILAATSTNGKSVGKVIVGYNGSYNNPLVVFAPIPLI